jgi:hypothetical protein
MKQAWSDLKSFVTIAFTLTIITLVIVVAIKGKWDIFQIVFTLFSNLATAVFTYFFTRKSKDGIVEGSEENERQSN